VLGVGPNINVSRCIDATMAVKRKTQHRFKVPIPNWELTPRLDQARQARQASTGLSVVAS
jgi:hypothetical protein